MSNSTAKTGSKFKVTNIVAIILLAILVPILILNLTLIAKTMINPDEVPTVSGIFPMIVLTDSMYPVIESGDMIICKTIDPALVKESDIISFIDPDGNGTSIVTHRVVEVVDDAEVGYKFRTAGDCNNANDHTLVAPEEVVGQYMFRIPKLGNVAMFMQSTTGLVICVFLPLVLFVAYDMIRNKKAAQQLLAEAEEAKAEAAKAAAEEIPAAEEQAEEAVEEAAKAVVNEERER